MRKRWGHLIMCSIWLPITRRWYYHKGRALAAIGKNEEAVVAFDNALAITPCDIPLLSAKGQALEALKRFKEAAATYEEAGAVDPTAPEHFYRLGLCYVALQRDEKAITAFAKTLSSTRNMLMRSNRPALSFHGWKNTKSPLPFLTGISTWTGQASVSCTRKAAHILPLKSLERPFHPLTWRSKATVTTLEAWSKKGSHYQNSSGMKSGPIL